MREYLLRIYHEEEEGEEEEEEEEEEVAEEEGEVKPYEMEFFFKKLIN